MEILAKGKTYKIENVPKFWSKFMKNHIIFSGLFMNKKNKKSKNINKSYDIEESKGTYFCTKCGKKMVATLIGAEKYYETFPNQDERIYPYTKYNKWNGERQYVYEYKCPKRRWYNRHDKFINNTIILK